ncbi:MAG: UDP-N-acetylmuramyl peptide synthase [Methanobrevibacter sp.]|jgi:UDP-N-acetylmuramate--alanine ligase/UDP-N-acetylmuramoyl-L-alanyl-D-glutamate--2,6-diaminopimelate ligase|nr:UDP-N-acetylmuramyl peptide synthase [Candidatus Methanovirga basalitermitum]
MKLNINSIAEAVSGRIIGNNFESIDKEFIGLFTVLDSAKEGDIVIRHWINEKGVKMANEKGVIAIITENILENSIEVAEKLEFPIIIVDEIEHANGFALEYTLNLFGAKSKKVIVSGTNGKSTTSHLIFSILYNMGVNVVTNTDSKSEFNTLIDPMVSKLISDYGKNNKQLDYVVIEVSEVQGWVNRLMKNHAYIMTKVTNPDVTVVTNMAMDHINLVNSIEEIYDEISGAVKATKKGTIILNKNDLLVESLKNLKNDKVRDFYFFYKDNLNEYNLNNIDEEDNLVLFDPYKKIISYKGKAVLKLDEIPFKSRHFIENILASISVCINLDIPLKYIIDGVKSYKPLKRRFTKLNENPLVIDDFAHNPDGIKATVDAFSKMSSNQDSVLWIVSAIRGSRGIKINELNSQALSDSILSCKNSNMKIKLIVSNSSDVVDGSNIVKLNEERSFLKILKKNKIDFIHFDKLHDGLNQVYNNAKTNDSILLIGAQGMDPAEEVLKTIKNEKNCNS